MDYKTAGVRPVVRHVEFNRLPRMTVRRRLVLSVPPRGPEFRRRKRPAYEMSSAGNRNGRPLAIAVAAMTLWWSAGPGAEAVTDDMLKIACDDMTPRHASYAAENSARTPCPYRLLANATAAVPGRPVRLTLTSPDGSVPFKGFMVQARDARSGRVLGTFLPDCSDGNRTYHMITCPNGGLPFNTVVQSNNKLKLKETFTWIAPITLKNPIRFKFTIVFDFEHFWVNEETDVIPVVKLSAEEYKIKRLINHEYYIYKLYIKNCST